MAAGFEREAVGCKMICGDAVAGAIACNVVASKALRKALNGVFTGNGAGLVRQLIKPDPMLAWTFPEALGAVIQIVVGALLTIKSRNLAGFWFKNEDD